VNYPSRPLHQQPTLVGSVARELAELTADLRAAVEWEQTGGALGWPETPGPAVGLPELVVFRPETSPRAGAAAAIAPRPARPTGGAADVPAAATPAAAPAPAFAPMPPGAEAADATTLDELRAVLGDCQRCKLAAARTRLVFGQGNPDADLLLVGEAPGYHEDQQGLAFVGPAGELLTRILQAIGFAREDVYICNAVKCRPPGNRDPLDDEVAVCRPFLARQVELVRPRVILALGRIAARALLERPGASIASLRGRFYEFQGVPLRVTYHPAALLRDGSLKRPVWEDVQHVRNRLTTTG
jgi:DNA polymerase